MYICEIASARIQTRFDYIIPKTILFSFWHSISKSNVCPFEKKSDNP